MAYTHSIELLVVGCVSMNCISFLFWCGSIMWTISNDRTNDQASGRTNASTIKIRCNKRQNSLIGQQIMGPIVDTCYCSLPRCSAFAWCESVRMFWIDTNSDIKWLIYIPLCFSSASSVFPLVFFFSIVYFVVPCFMWFYFVVESIKEFLGMIGNAN